jgi:hypothetical protein
LAWPAFVSSDSQSEEFRELLLGIVDRLFLQRRLRTARLARSLDRGYVAGSTSRSRGASGYRVRVGEHACLLRVVPCPSRKTVAEVGPPEIALSVNRGATAR